MMDKYVSHVCIIHCCDVSCAVSYSVNNVVQYLHVLLIVCVVHSATCDVYADVIRAHYSHISQSYTHVLREACSSHDSSFAECKHMQCAIWPIHVAVYTPQELYAHTYPMRHQQLL
jgi:hypothetical protein